jgi:hypothetical protein
MVAGVCNCMHFKCLNCQSTDHHCREKRCPACNLFCPNTARKTQKAKDKGKGREWDLVQDPNEEERLTAKEAEYDFGDKDLFNPISLPPEATFCQICEARNKEVDRAIYNTMVGSTSTAGPSLSMLPRDAGPQPMDYSLLRPQGSAAIGPVTQ